MFVKYFFLSQANGGSGVPHIWEPANETFHQSSHVASCGQRGHEAHRQQQPRNFLWSQHAKRRCAHPATFAPRDSTPSCESRQALEVSKGLASNDEAPGLQACPFAQCRTTAHNGPDHTPLFYRRWPHQLRCRPLPLAAAQCFFMSSIGFWLACESGERRRAEDD